MATWLRFFLATSLIISNGCCLRLIHLDVPPQVDFRDNVTLTCDFDLEGKGMYSLKWYKDEFEFYRFMPDNQPPEQSFPAPGVSLDALRSNINRVRLVDLSFNTSGIYRCEISTEGPNFQTVLGRANMSVLGLLRRDPTLEGFEATYVIGDDVTGNCTASASNPPCIVSWYINGAKADSHHLEYYPLLTDNSDRFPLYTRSLGLRISAAQRFFMSSGAQLQLRCVATLGDRRWQRSLYPVLVRRTEKRGRSEGSAVALSRASLRGERANYLKQ